MKNIYQSNYLNINIFSQINLTLKDNSIVEKYNIHEDIYVLQVSKFTLSKNNINAVIGDYVYITNDINQKIYLGIITNIENIEENKFCIVNCKPIIGILYFKILVKNRINELAWNDLYTFSDHYFNQDSFLKEFWKNNLIWTNKSDNSKYTFIQDNQSEISFFDFYKIIYNQTRNYLSFELNIKNKKINITFNSPNNEAYYLKDNINDIYNLKIDDFYKQAINKLDIYDENNNFKESWYLLKNNEIINKEILDKILNTWNNKVSAQVIEITVEGKKITLDLIKNSPIGTKTFGSDRTTYLQLVEDNIWYLYQNNIEDEKSYSNIAVANFLKQSNKIIFAFPNNENTWNEIEKYNIFNWNEFLELEKFITEPQTELENLADVKKYIENIKNKKDIKSRILPIINKTAKLDKKINIFDYAKQELEQSKYSHSIEFDINKNTNILDLNKIKLGDKFILYFNNKEYETILSAIQYENNKNTIHLIFGKARINFIDMLKTKNI
ncbi:hypothetical protein [Spiroplasma endosymbiont of Megaselia nigra]|uniref:hypothetical protein n=1 Tax=Spiroplasma endosymbiont of Megaselia nigra TaxID=2478537 RepID=UPI000F89B1C8|nr:hypothetical protein [Spiroplasma endosymbiont of Megaselia nigra]RUO86165.1 hypothetical protein D9R21_04710 [Spiroplasma endosymbiont of Megaselia nigra]